jgi:peptidoglycan/xylan/chitin deacetylase (PgdA/CDA1 family)
VPALDSRRFEAQVRHLKRNYRVVSASELPAAVADRQRGERIPVAITFDDDLPSHAETAAPILSRHGTAATFFLCGASLREPFAFWWERLQRAFDHDVDVSLAFAERPIGSTIHSATNTFWELSPHARLDVFERLGALLGDDPADAGMRADDVRALTAAGFEIGFHTKEHHVLTTLGDAELGTALRDGRAELEALSGQQLDLIAYPHGEVDERVASAARAAGYRVGFTTERQPVRPGTDPLCVGRYEPFLASIGTFALDIARTLTGTSDR